MKKKLGIFILLSLLGAAVAGCGAEEPAVYASLQAEPIESSQEEVIQEQVKEPETSQESKAVAETADLTFTDLSKRRFEFSSGAGGWWEEFTI